MKIKINGLEVEGDSEDIKDLIIGFNQKPQEVIKIPIVYKKPIKKEGKLRYSKNCRIAKVIEDFEAGKGSLRKLLLKHYGYLTGGSSGRIREILVEKGHDIKSDFRCKGKKTRKKYNITEESSNIRRERFKFMTSRAKSLCKLYKWSWAKACAQSSEEWKNRKGLGTVKETELPRYFNDHRDKILMELITNSKETGKPLNFDMEGSTLSQTDLNNWLSLLYYVCKSKNEICKYLSWDQSKVSFKVVDLTLEIK